MVMKAKPKEKRSRKTGPPPPPPFGAIREVLENLSSLTDPELIVLKGQIAVEQMLYRAGSRALRRRPGELPPQKYGTLVDFAFEADWAEARKRTIWLNDARNIVAHQIGWRALGGLPSDSMSKTGPNETLGWLLVLPLFRARGESGGRAFQRVPLSPRAAVGRPYDGVDGGVALGVRDRSAIARL
jgi:hypothetical protein